MSIGLHGWLILLRLPTPLVDPDVYPPRGNGFPAEIVPALFGVAILVLAAIWLSSKPRRGRPNTRPRRRWGRRQR